ncbi:hypothetical protein JCM15908A_11800 [Prevotella dentasini JCM 15908]
MRRDGYAPVKILPASRKKQRFRAAGKPFAASEKIIYGKQKNYIRLAENLYTVSEKFIYG